MADTVKDFVRLLPYDHPYRYDGTLFGGPELWTPAELTSLLAWFDAYDEDTITEVTNLVSQWDDKSGNANHATQGTGSLQPTTDSVTVNGLNVLNFSDDTLGGLSITTMRAAFVVTNNILGSTGSANVAPLWSETYDAVNRSDGTFMSRAGTYDLSLDGFEEPKPTGSASYNGGSIVTGDGKDIDLGSDNTEKLSPNIWYMQHDSTQNVNLIADYSGGTYKLKGDIGEIVFLDAVPSDADRKKLEGYLAHKWGLVANLPWDHTYKWSPPSSAALTELWTPSQITTLGWYDAYDEDTITDVAGAVSQVDDKSGNTQHLVQATGADQPSTGTRTINSLNALDFDGSSDYLHYDTFAVPSSGDIAIFMVAVVDGISNIDDALFAMNATNDFEFGAKASVPASQYNGYINVTGSIGADVEFTGGPHEGPSIYNLNFDWATGSVYNGFVDGTQRGADTTYNTTKLDTSQILTVMADRGDNNYLDGAFGELIIVEDVTAATRIKIEGYLAHKWGLTANLPTDHAYKTVAPIL